MNCAQCSLNIEAGAKTMQMPCCALVYHSQCGINRLFSGSYFSNIECLGCGNHLHDSPYYTSNGSNQEEIETGNQVLEGDAKPDLKKLKEKSKEVSLARKQLEQHLKEEFEAFQEIALPQLEAIKALKDTRLAAIKQSPEYKTFNSKKQSFSLMFAKFQKKYPTISRRCLRQKIGVNCFRWRYNSSPYMVRRKFRLKKWY